MKKFFTLCLVKEKDRLLLGFKKRGFGAGRWNGFGGKPRLGETLEEAAARELAEEAGLKAKQLDKRGVLNFEFGDSGDLLEVHLYVALSWFGQPRESEEMKPRWFAFSEIPFAKMWPDDRYWLPLFIADKYFEGDFYFLNSDNLVSHHIFEVPRI